MRQAEDELAHPSRARRTRMWAQQWRRQQAGGRGGQLACEVLKVQTGPKEVRKGSKAQRRPAGRSARPPPQSRCALHAGAPHRCGGTAARFAGGGRGGDSEVGGAGKEGAACAGDAAAAVPAARGRHVTGTGRREAARAHRAITRLWRRRTPPADFFPCLPGCTPPSAALHILGCDTAATSRRRRRSAAGRRPALAAEWAAACAAPMPCSPMPCWSQGAFLRSVKGRWRA